MCEHLRQRNVVFPVAREFGDVVGNAVVEAQESILDQTPDSARNHRLRLRVQQPTGLRCRLLRRSEFVVDPGLTKLAVGNELLVSAHRDRSPWIPTPINVTLNQAIQPFKSSRVDARTSRLNAGNDCTDIVVHSASLAVGLNGQPMLPKPMVVRDYRAHVLDGALVLAFGFRA
jgi:hypothetical protein